MSRLEKTINKEITKTEKYLKQVNELLKNVEENEASIKVLFHGK